MMRWETGMVIRACCVALLWAAPGASLVAAQDETPLVLLGTGSAEPGAATGFDAQTHQRAFGLAVEAYRKGAYGEAQELFALLAAGEPDLQRRAILHVNAGTSAARAESAGLAVWHLEAALRCAPRDAIARRNLDQVRARLGQPSLAAASFTESLLRLPLWLGAAESEQLLGGLIGLALLLLCFRRSAPRFAVRASLFFAVLAALSWLAIDQARARDLQRAVVVADAQVRAEPRAQGKLLFRLDTGTIVRAEERRAGWQLVETDGGGRGWAPGASIMRAGF